VLGAKCRVLTCTPLHDPLLFRFTLILDPRSRVNFTPTHDGDNYSYLASRS
jgi:hypothetical protein